MYNPETAKATKTLEDLAGGKHRAMNS